MADDPLSAYEGDGPYVFVSYSHEDEGVVYPEIRWLQEQGINVWYDTGIHPGSEWSEALASAIKRASQLLYFITPQSVASENCRQELNFALTEGIRVQAVHLTETKVPDGLRLRLENRQVIMKHRVSETDYRRALLRGVTGARVDLAVEARGEAPSRSTSRLWVVTGSIVIVLAFALIATQVGLFSTGTDIPVIVESSSQAETTGAIAILPLANLSGDPNQEYVADGMTAELISEIGRLEGLTVISQTSVMRYKTERPSVRTIGDELDVAWVLEGSVAREGDAIRVNVNLIDAETDRQVWSATFDRRGSSVLALRSDVADAIANELRLELGVVEMMPHVVDEDAYDAYLRAIAMEFTDAARVQALETAVELDPQFAAGWSALAGTYFLRLWDPTAGPRARQYAERAIQLDPTLASPHAILAQVANLYENDHEAAIRHSERALELNPNDKLSVIVSMFVNSSLQRFDKALAAAHRLRRLDPLDPDTAYVRVELYAQVRLYERGIAAAKHAREYVVPGYTNRYESTLFAALGRFEEAAEARFDVLTQCGERCIGQLEAAQRGWRERGHAGRLLAELEYLGEEGRKSFDYGLLRTRQADLDAAFEWLSDAVAQQVPLVRSLASHPANDRFRMDSRFAEIMSGVGLPQIRAHPARRADEGRALAFMGRGREAIERVAGAMDESPDDERLPRWQESMAWAHFAARDYAQARRWTSRVLEHDLSRYAEAHAHLLIASNQGLLDNHADARSSLSRALKLWPTLEFERDLAPLFIGGDESMRDSFAEGLIIAGLPSG